jgi:hypothetical protein
MRHECVVADYARITRREQNLAEKRNLCYISSVRRIQAALASVPVAGERMHWAWVAFETC